MKNTDAIGKIVWLMGQSKYHKHWSVQDIYRLIYPALALQQFRLYENEKMPFGLITWAFLTEEVANNYVKRKRKLQPDDWKAGNQLWSIDVIIPFGKVLPVIREARQFLSDRYGKNIKIQGHRTSGRIWKIHL